LSTLPRALHPPVGLLRPLELISKALGFLSLKLELLTDALLLPLTGLPGRIGLNLRRAPGGFRLAATAEPAKEARQTRTDGGADAGGR